MAALVGKLCWAVIGGLVVHFGQKKPMGGAEHLAAREAKRRAHEQLQFDNAAARRLSEERNRAAVECTT